MGKTASTASSAVPRYPERDLRRMIVAVAALAELKEATVARIVERSALDKKSVMRLLANAQAQAGVVIEKDGPVYRFIDWGPLINKKGARALLRS